MKIRDAPPGPAQVRAARALLEWSQSDLSAAARVSLSTVRDFEAGRRQPMRNNIEAMQRALEEAGMIFVPENGEGPGVRMRKVRECWRAA